MSSPSFVKMAAMRTYDLHQNQESVEAESFYIFGPQDLPSCANNYPMLTVDSCFVTPTRTHIRACCKKLRHDQMCGKTRRVLHGICRHALAVLLR